MDLHRLFHPESVAVVGASPHIGGGKLPYYQVLQMAGYKGRLYPVNPKYDSIAGAKVYASLDDLPEPVDLAIASVPYEKALETVEAAARRGVKFIHFFTSGFSEVGNHDLERIMNTLGNDVRKNQVAASLLLTQPGVPFIYYGEEIGMAGIKGLEGDAPLRAPMSWTAEKQGSGFTTGQPFRPVSPNAARYNAEAQL
ncbi:MAG TPA: CoA-binding protein, partial [Deltaproteobacteria bacterium]|nr:CoA-binding protein [Deltaproteobacteria bacterium]